MIRTGGGTYDPAVKHLYFVAGDPPQAHRSNHLTAVNDAITDNQTRESIEEPLARGSRLLLDSGIFNLTNRHMRATGITMDEALALPPEALEGFDALFDRYVELVRRYEPRLWGYIELDQGGRDNKRRTRARLHDLGLNPIPVYHPLNDGWDYFDELAAGYDRICFGNIVQAAPTVRLRLLHTMWERRRRYPHLWIHVLGLTASEIVLAYPPDSCDSSTFTSALRWGDSGLENTMLHRGLGGLGRGYVYDRQVDHYHERGWLSCARLYAEAFDNLTTAWQQIQADLTELGAPAWPAPLPEEGELRP